MTEIAFKLDCATVYHVRRDKDRQSPMQFHYSLEQGIVAEIEPNKVFDVRDLPQYTREADLPSAILAALADGTVNSVTGEKINPANLEGNDHEWN
jgi:hypothetical protein